MGGWAWVRFVVIVVTALVSLGFMLDYHRRAEWWRRPIGRWLMAEAAGIFAVTGLWATVITTRLTGHGIPSWFDPVAVAVLAPLPVLMVVQWVLMVRVQNRLPAAEGADDGPA